MFPIFSYFGHFEYNWHKYLWTILNVQSFLLNQGYNQELHILITQKTEQLQHLERNMDIVNNSAIMNGTKKKLAHTLHKNGKRDWKYDAMEETACHKISVNKSSLQLTAEDKSNSFSR